jgi:transcriptional repressor NrdR
MGLAVDRIVEGVSEDYEREVPAQVIGERVMRELHALDPVAYIRFASIYRQFEEITDFVEEATRLAALPKPDKRQMELLGGEEDIPEVRKKERP